MMKYLYKIFRELNGPEFEEQYQKRIHYETYQRLPFHIRPMNVQKSFQLYFIPTVNMMLAISELYQQDKILMELFNEIPDIAKQNFLFDCLVEELQNTNELEGVRSSKEEIVRSARELEKDPLSKERFTSLINSYKELLSGTLRLLEKPSDVRKIYDYLVSDEIAKNERLMGKYSAKM